MELNRRVAATGGISALGWGPSLAAWQVLAYGRVQFDLSSAADIALVNSATPKSVTWYGDATYEAADEITPGPLSAFGIELSNISASGTGLALYDDAAEIRLRTLTSDSFVTAWAWPTSMTTPGAQNETTAAGGRELIMYQGSPVVPSLGVRPGLIVGTSPADAVVTVTFRLIALPQAAFGAVRIFVPAPYCVPPFVAFGANRGTHIFQGHATAPQPRPQKLPFARQFRTIAFDTVASATNPQIDARIFGGPWRGRLTGATDSGAATSAWNIQGLLAQVADPVVIPYTPAPIVGVATSASANLNTGPESTHDALRFTQADASTGGRTEILVESGDAT